GQRLEDLGGATNTVIDTYVNEISGPYSGNNSDFVLLPKLGLHQQRGPHFVGLQYTRGYRTAGLRINRRRADIVEYDPEFTNNYEASYRYIRPDVIWSNNFFYIDWRDQQVLVQLSNDFYDSQVENAARAAVYGTEGELQYNMTHSQ